MSRTEKTLLTDPKDVVPHPHPKKAGVSRLPFWSLHPHSPSKQLAKLLKKNKTKTKPDLAEGQRLNN